jgi:hypothetical protein
MSLLSWPNLRPRQKLPLPLLPVRLLPLNGYEQRCYKKAEVAFELKANAKRELQATVASPPFACASPPFACALLQAKA